MFKQLQDMALFALVVECGSFTTAAKRVGLPKSSVSKRISQLEQQLGLRLLTRTTRNLSLTFAGERYLAHCKEIVSASERAQNSIQSLKASPSGRIRITAPAGLTTTLLATVVSDFQKRNPSVSFEVYASDDISDLVASGYDIALRTGKPKDSGLIGRSLGRTPRYLLASPEYLADFAPIVDPAQLTEHRAIVHKAWTQCELVKGNRRHHWHLPTDHLTDNLLYARQCAIMGAGITLLSDFLCRDAIENKTLLPVLPDWRVEANELYLVYPSRKLNSPALTLFIETLVNHPVFKPYHC